MLTLVAPKEPVRPGSVIRIDVVGLNPTYSEPLRFDAKQTLRGELNTATVSFPVTLTASSPSTRSVDPRTFAVRPYSMTVPDAANGAATLIVHDGNINLISVLNIAADGGAPGRDALEGSAELDKFARSLPGRLSIYLPSYFIYGSGHEPAGKYQFSLKYRLFSLGRATETHTPASFQLAYTQRSLWDLRAPSKPFFDTSYMPEVFLESEYPRDLDRDRSIGFLGWPFSLIGWAGGIRHESNGKDGDDSRSYNIAYLRAHISAGSPASWFVAVAPEAWAYVTSHDHMPDVEKYRGQGRLILIGGHGTGASIMYIAQADRHLGHLTHEANFFVPVGVRRLDFATYLIAQYFNGYAESERAFTHKSHSLRFGFSLVR